MIVHGDANESAEVPEHTQVTGEKENTSPFWSPHHTRETTSDGGA